jgi:hypothetical protein
MTQPRVIKSIALIVVFSFLMAWLGQYVMYHYHIADGICFTNDCPAATRDAIIGTSFKILLFSLAYFVFVNPTLAKLPGMELSILLVCLIVNFIHFNNTNAYLCLIPYNIVTVRSYYKVKRQLGKPFKPLSFILQEFFLLLLFLSTYVYLDELFVSKGLDRDIVMYTSGEKLFDRIITFFVWTIFSIHMIRLILSLRKRKTVLKRQWARVNGEWSMVKRESANVNQKT